MRRRQTFSHYPSWETLWSVGEEDTRKRDDPRLSTSFSPLFLVGEPGLENISFLLRRQKDKKTKTFPRRRARIGKHFTSTSESLFQVFATMFLLITQLVICKHLLFCPASLAVDMYQHTRFCFIDFFSF